MPKYLIERELPGVGSLGVERMSEVARRSNDVLRSLRPQIQWVQSYVTANKMTCVYIAPDADTVREHAGRGGFPADSVEEILMVVDPTTEAGAVYVTPAARLPA